MNCITCNSLLIPIDVKEGIAYKGHGKPVEGKYKITIFDCPNHCKKVTGFEAIEEPEGK